VHNLRALRDLKKVFQRELCSRRSRKSRRLCTEKFVYSVYPNINTKRINTIKSCSIQSALNLRDLRDLREIFFRIIVLQLVNHTAFLSYECLIPEFFLNSGIKFRRTNPKVYFYTINKKVI